MISKLLFFLLLFSYPGYSKQDYIHEQKLKQDLLKDYRADTLPTINTSEPIDLQLGIAFRAFNSIDQVDGILNLNIWLRYKWNDFNLKWNPQDYNNITNIALYTNPEFSDSIWVPDIYLYNTAEMPLSELDYSMAHVYNDGTVAWSRPGMIKATCLFDLEYFPYDQQNCKLKFGSWVYHMGQVNLTEGEPHIDITNLQKNQGWDLINYTSVLNIEKYSCCPELYADITYNLVIRRRSGYYDLNILLPTFATSTLMLISFLVPWDSGERISFATTVMLSIIVFLLILSENLPKTDTKPLLSRMLVGLTFFSLFIVFFTVVVSAMYSYDKKKKSLFSQILEYFNITTCKKSNNNNEYNRNDDAVSIDSYSQAIENSNVIPLKTINLRNRIINVDDCITENNRNNNGNNTEINSSNNTNNDEKNNDKDDNCDKTAQKLEVIFTLIFLFGFIIFSVAMFTSIPAY